MPKLLFGLSFVEADTIEASMNVKLDGEEHNLPILEIEYDEYSCVLGKIVDIASTFLAEQENKLMEQEIEESKNDRDPDGLFSETND